MGSVFHAGVASLLRGRSLAKAEKTMSTTWEKMLSGMFISGKNEKLIETAKVTCIGAIRGYDQVRPLGDIDIIHTEDFFEIKLGKGLYINGTADVVAEGSKTGTIDIYDHKFTGQPHNYDASLLPLDAQAMCYPFGLSQKYGKPVRGFTWDLIRKPSIRQRQSETYVEYLIRLSEDYQERPEFYFVQRSALFNMRHVDVLKAEMSQFIRELRDKIIAVKTGQMTLPEAFGRNGDYCSRYGRCAYAPLCIRGETALTRRMYTRQKDDYDMAHE